MIWLLIPLACTVGIILWAYFHSNEEPKRKWRGNKN